MENPIKMGWFDDLGVPLFSETPIYLDIMKMHLSYPIHHNINRIWVD